jgi:CBS domain containing-hemolysin-like protein
MIAWETAIVVGVLCVLIEGFFSGSEIALVSANRALLRRKSVAGDRGAALAEKFLARPEVLLATTLIGTNLATVTFSVVVTLALLGHGVSRSEILAVAIVSPPTLLLAETVPKTLFQYYADKLAPRVVYPLRLFSVIVRPGVWLMSGFAIAMTRLLGTDRERAFVTRDELALLIEAESERSEITSNEREMISNVLEMSDRTAAEVMVPLSEVVALPEDATLGEAALEVADKQHTRIPIYRARVDDIVGVLHAFDLLRSGADGKAQLVSRIARAPTFVPESKPAVDLLVELQGTGNQMAVVVDEYGGAIGIVSVEDILEEIVGEIDDEYDTGPSPIRREAPGVWLVEARTSIERINQELGLELPDDREEFESIAGLLLERMKRIPQPGELLRVGGVTVTVVESSDRAVDTVRIRVDKRKR